MNTASSTNTTDTFQANVADLVARSDVHVVAESLGVSPNTVRKVLRGEHVDRHAGNTMRAALDRLARGAS